MQVPKPAYPYVGAEETSPLSGVSYKFLQKLGKGSFGEVWKALDSNGKTVAVKAFKIDTQRVFADMEHEIACLKRVSRICSKYAVCYHESYISIQDDKPRVVMEFVEGKTLDKLLFEETVFSRRKMGEKIITDLVLGLKTIHETGTAHQDIKEENLIWDTSHKQFRYLDWGLCCYNNFKHQFGYECGSVGTPYTTPPELAKGRNAEELFKATDWYTQTPEQMVAHDIWSLGIILLRWFTMPHDRINFPQYYNLNETQIWEMISPSKTGNALVSQILKSLLKINPVERSSRFNAIVDLIRSGQPFYKRLCKSVNEKDMFLFTDNSDRKMYCFSRKEIVNNPAYRLNIHQRTFVNPFTNNIIKESEQYII